MLNRRLAKFLEQNKILHENQAGFRRGYGTVDHIFVFKCLIDIFCANRRKLFCAFVDYQKAFDTVWREGLWVKLIHEGISGKIFNVIRSMYSNIKSCVFAEEEQSEYFVSNVGVRQGENFLPVLFSLYVKPHNPLGASIDSKLNALIPWIYSGTPLQTSQHFG